jgi:hypothetical protein
MKKIALLLFAASTLPAQSLKGLWDATVTVNGQEIPFRMELAGTPPAVQGWFFNGDEKVISTSGRFEDNRLLLLFDYYAGKLEATFKDGEFTDPTPGLQELIHFMRSASGRHTRAARTFLRSQEFGRCKPRAPRANPRGA